MQTAWRSCQATSIPRAADFRRICEDAKPFASETDVKRLSQGPLDEWGAGSIGYPNRETGSLVRPGDGVGENRERLR